jgi:ferredoxin
MSRFVYLKDVVTLSLDSEKCYGCGMCLEVCPHRVLAKDNGKVSIKDKDACMECGACAKNCPSEALKVSVGVGCAAAVINAALGRTSSSCCCVIEPEETAGENKSVRSRGSGCC